MKRALLGLTATVALCAGAAPAGAVTWLAGNAAACEQWVCGDVAASNRFTRTLRAEDLAGISSISRFLLDRRLLAGRENTSFHLTFWNADGEKVGDFGHFVIAFLGGEEVSLVGREFAYNPLWGDLQVRVDLDVSEPGIGGFAWGPSGGGGGGGSFSLAAPSEGGESGGGGGGTITQSFALTDDPPSIAAPIPVPEPGAWALMITGFGAAGAMLRRRKSALAI